MTMTGSCLEFGYKADDQWARLPAGWAWREAAAVATDSRDRVFVFHRGEHPVLVFGRDGTFVTSWGEGLFARPHGLYIGPDDAVYCTIRWVGPPFNFPTNLALAPDGAMYVSDGYGNARIHKFTPEGRLLLSWGDKGSGPGQFHIPHGIAI